MKNIFGISLRKFWCEEEAGKTTKRPTAEEGSPSASSAAWKQQLIMQGNRKYPLPISVGVEWNLHTPTPLSKQIPLGSL